jgi:hypothetical protein
MMSLIIEFLTMSNAPLSSFFSLMIILLLTQQSKNVEDQQYNNFPMDDFIEYNESNHSFYHMLIF